MACLGMITSVLAIAIWFAWLSGFAQPLTSKALQLGTVGFCIASGRQRSFYLFHTILPATFL